MSAGPDAAHTILTITDDGGTAMVTTAGPHGFDGITPYPIVISGNSIAEYNGSQEAGFTPTATTFYIVTPYSFDGTGGSWRLA